MTGAQYKNVAQWTLSGAVAAEAADTVTVARAIFNNMGVAFPGGTCQEILLTLMSGDYMGWGECTYAQAQEFANAGVAAVGVDVDHVIVVLPDDSAVGLMDASAAPTAYARQTSDIPKTERMAMQFFAYGAGSSTTTTTRPPVRPMMTNVEYYNKIHATALLYPDDTYTYCNRWLHYVLDKCNIPYPTGGCTAERRQYNIGFDLWKPCDYQGAQRNANNGHAAIAITDDHVVAVTPNNIPPKTGSIPGNVGAVFVSQSGKECFYDGMLSKSWGSNRWPEIQFFYYDK